MEEKYINKEINPCEDFYEYATGNWLKYNKQKKEYPSWSTFLKLHDENIKRITNIIKNCKDSNEVIEKKIYDFYSIVMNWERRDKEGFSPVRKYLNDKFYNIVDTDNLITTLAVYHQQMLFSLCIEADLRNSDMNAIYLDAHGLSLENKEYYLEKTKDNLKIYNAWKSYVVKLLQLYGYEKEEARRRFKIIAKIEKQIAKVSHSVEEKRDPLKIYNKFSVEKISKICKFNFDEYLKIFGYDETTEVIVNNIEHLKLCCKILNTYDIKDLLVYAEYFIINRYSNYLDSTVEKLGFKFEKAFFGTKKMMSHEKKAINSTEGIFGDEIGKIYCKKYFKKSAKDDVINLIDNLKLAFSEIINEQAWLSNETKEIAQYKLSKLKYKIGYPNKIDDISDIPVDTNLSLFDNILEIFKYFFIFNKNKKYNKPVDKELWEFYPQKVNAYYNPCNNEICFPAGILQKPFYNEKYSLAENFGGIGVVIGHEMTHGYDNHGREFDPNGNMNQWMKEDEIKTFNELANQTEENFSSMEALPGLKCDGKLTLPENLADYGGVKIAWRALNHVKKDLSEEEKKAFFISFAQVWAGTSTDEFIKQSVLNNEHSVKHIRVNGTLRTFTPWQELFNVKKENNLYLEENKRAKIW